MGSRIHELRASGTWMRPRADPKFLRMESVMRLPSTHYRGSLLVAAAAFVLGLAPGIALARTNPKISVTVGQSVTQRLASDVKTVSIADSKVADVVVVGPREVLVNGKAVGLTTLVVWDDVRGATVFDVVVQGPFSEQQIELQVKVAEINRTKAAELGIDLLGINKKSDETVTGGSFGGQV